ncbi:DDE-type integrase/transposase/recombinase [Candidatus Enterovibrio escicola]|nr:DDE-type integrase/transposase/recombinase [Candidatus Enterovibrio escacola]
MAKWDIKLDHSTINLWVIKYSILLEQQVRRIKKCVTSSSRMDKAYINVKGQWKYYYLAIDKFGNVIKFLLCKHRFDKEALALFNKVNRP